MKSTRKMSKLLSWGMIVFAVFVTAGRAFADHSVGHDPVARGQANSIQFEVNTLEEDVGQLQTDVGTNTSAIGANTGNISTNTSMRGEVNASQSKVEICHYDEVSQSWVLLNIAERSVVAHVANHDDCAEPECVTASGVFLNDACEVGLAAPAFGSAAIFGDPHFQTWDGMTFEFQGLGIYDAILVNGGSPHVQLMTRELALDSGVTVTWGVAIAVGGDVVEIEANPAGATPLAYVNSLLVSDSYLPLTGGTIINTSSYVEFVGLDGLRLHAVLGSGDSLNVSITAPATLKYALTGLLGTYNDSPFDDFTSRSGSSIPISSPLSDVYNDHGLTWAVAPVNSLFDAITFADNSSFFPVFTDGVDFDDPEQFDPNLVFACEVVCESVSMSASIVGACEHDCIFKGDLDQSATYGAAGFTGSLDTLSAATLQCATGSYGAACDACNCPGSPCADGLLGSGVCLE